MIHNLLLKVITIDPSVVNLYKEMLDKTLGADDKQNANEAKRLKTQLVQIDEHAKRSQDLMLDGKLDPDEYVNIKTRLSVQTLELKNKIDRLKSTNTEVKSHAKAGLNLLTNIAETYSKSSIQLKHKIVCSIFPEFL